ncbi:MAG: SEC-C metal-binding domain-containing protein, partial [Pseudomonadota bacterium]|nr:SEC-C metal-binding domain-containing protein [Pseudomonadota bacterium]
DNIMNDQRKVIYDQRREIMASADDGETVRELREQVVHNLVARAIPQHSYAEQWDLAGLAERAKDILALDLPIDVWAKEDGLNEHEIEQRILKLADAKAADKFSLLTDEARRRGEKAALLSVLDQSWKEHLLALDHLRQGIHLRGYGQRDPLNEYNREAFGLYNLMLEAIREDVTRTLMRSEVRLPSLEDIMSRRPPEMQEVHDEAPDLLAPFGGEPLPQGMVLRHPAAAGPQAPRMPVSQPIQNVSDAKNPDTWHQTPRNAACPCGSGKKYKHCHGTTA